MDQPRQAAHGRSLLFKHVKTTLPLKPVLETHLSGISSEIPLLTCCFSCSHFFFCEWTTRGYCKLPLDSFHLIIETDFIIRSGYKVEWNVFVSGDRGAARGFPLIEKRLKDGVFFFFLPDPTPNLFYATAWCVFLMSGSQEER